jgi:signal peptidase
MTTLPQQVRDSLIARLLRLTGTIALAGVMAMSVAFLLPSLLGYERYVITGGSMSGTFEKGSVAFEKPVAVEDLEVGDVITYLPPADSGLTTLVTHRIVTRKATPDGGLVFRTQGDANPDPDPWRFRLSAATQPRVELTVPYVGYLFLALADRDTRVLLVGVPAGLVGLHSLGELVAAARSRARARRSTAEPATGQGTSAPPAPQPVPASR